MPEPTRYYGKYRGTVVNNIDPLRMGRLQAQVPDVLGDTPSTWAMPSFPVAGPQMGQYVIPLAGQPDAPSMVLQTRGQRTIVLSDLPGDGITLRTATGAMLMINDAGILI